MGSVPGNEPHHDGDRGNGERGNHELAALRDDQAKPAAEKTPGHDYTIEGDGPAPKTPKQRFYANIEAIKLLKQLETEGRMPTPAEQSVLAAYSSWGGLTKAFQDGTKENTELRKLLTKEEYDAAKRSILDAYFTPPAIVRAIWKGVSSLGFQGGRVLDPSMGVGNFFGCMPESMRKASALTGVEIDDLSSRFANMLYPSADVEHAGFQNAHVADDSCDLVISNVPFSQAKIGKYALHNYFFANGIDKVRPGGLMVFITSQSSLTSGGDAATMRAYLNGHADLIGGFKLPSGVFKGTGTDVATDVLAFQKRGADGKVSPHAKGFTNVMDYTFTRADGSKAQVPSNKYFYDNPGNVLGKKELGRDRFGKDAMNILPRDGQDTAAELAKAMAKLPNVYEPVNRTDAKPFQQKTADKKARADEKRRDMEYFTDGGKLYQNQDGVRVAVPTRKAKAVKSYLGVRESLRTLFLAENDPDAKPSVLDSLRKKLNQTYDAFVKAHGFLNEPKNVRLFGDDPNAGSVLALETDVKLEGNGAKRHVVSAQKAGIFHQRTVQSVKPVTHTDNAKDALLASLNQTGKVDVDYMAKLTGKSPAAVVQELGDTIYQDPTTEGYETADEYLSGNVREKLAQAQKAAKKNPTYQRNVDALKKVVPADLVSSEILVNINSPWIPVEDLNAFMEHLTGASVTSWQGMTIARASNGRYVVDGSGYGASKWKPDGVEFRDLIDSVLNNKPVEVAHKDEDGHRIVDQEKTDAANAAADRIRDEFQNWIWSDKEREQRLVKYYNENYNGEVLRTYDGSHLTFPGMNSGVKLRGHQKNVIWRMLQKVNTLIAHCVGAGKTWEMQAAGMEMRRLGIANKPLYCVPNNIVEQFAREFQTLYPNAKLLVLKTGDDLPEVFRAKVTKTEDGRKVVHYLKPSQMSKDDRAKYEEKCRARLRALTRIKTEDWDGIIMSHNMFERLPVSGETTAAYIKEEIAILEQTLKEAEARKQRGKNANGLRVRDLQTRLETLKSKLEEATNQDLKAVGIPFEELGIDQIFVDEADMFKNLHFMTTIGDVSGLTNPKSANRSTDMFIKTQWLTKRNGGRGVVFATGTPISNTMAEMYTMMRYLDSAGLKERGVELFDNWIRQYGDIGTGIERKPSGDGYRKVQKVKHFLNMPELTKAFRKFTDVFTRDELIEEDPNITIPKLKNDKRTVIALAPDPAIVDYIKRVVPERIKNMKGRGKQKKGDDNMLALTNDLRKLSMTDRKIDACAEQVAKKYRETDAEHGAQAIFCDMGVPRAEKENATSTDRDANESAAETENKAVYDRLIASLVAHGIPREQIAFAQQAKNKQAQDELFQKVDRGDIRVIIGTTQKMGAGTNFQRHLAAEHHLDAPWRPRDIEQREGRILRQGNGNKEVEIFTYVVKDSFDANMWEKIKNKASIISQAMSPNIMERSLEDADLVTLSYADVESAATGNPYIKQMLDAKADVAKLTNASTQFQKQQHDAERKAKELPATIKNEKNILALIEEDKAARIDTHGDKFQMEIAGKTYDKRADADKALDALPLKTAPQDVGHIGEYRIRAWVDMGGETHAEIVRNRAYPANKLNAQSIERALRDGVDGAAKAHDGNIKSQQQELKDAKDVLKEQNPYTEKLKAAREQQRQLEQKINDYMTEKPQATDTAPTASATPTETEAEPKETFDVNKTPFYISGSYISYEGKLSKETYDALEKLADKDGADKGSFFRNEEDGNFSVTFNYRRTNTKRDTFIRDAMKLIEQDKAAQEAPATSNTWREILSAPTKNELAEKIRKHLKSRYLTIGGVNADGTYHVSSLATYKEISDGVVREVNGEWQFGKYEEAKKPYNLDNSLHVATADNRKWFDEHVHVAGIPDAHYRKQTEVNAETETEKKRRELKEVYEEPDSRVKTNGPFLYLDCEGLGHAQIRNMRGMLEDLAQGQARSLKAVGGSKMLGVQPKFQYYISNNYSLMMRIKEAIDKEYPKHSRETKAETSNQPSKPTHYEAADVFRSTALWNPTTGKAMPSAQLTIHADDFAKDALETIADNYGGYYDEKQNRFFFDNAESRDKFVKKGVSFINGHADRVHYSVSEGDVRQAEARAKRTAEDLKREIARAFPNAKNVKDEGDRVTFDMPNGSHVEVRIHDNMTVTGEEAARARRDHGIADGVTIRVNGSMYTLGRDVVLDLSRKGEAGTSYHEALHAAMELLFDDKAKAALHKKYGSEEKIADAYRRFMLAENRGGHVTFGKLFRAIRDFFRGLASHIPPIQKRFGDAWTAQKAFEDLASGKAWQPATRTRSHGFSLFSRAEAAERTIDNEETRGDNEGETKSEVAKLISNENLLNHVKDTQTVEQIREMCLARDKRDILRLTRKVERLTNSKDPRAPIFRKVLKDLVSILNKHRREFYDSSNIERLQEGLRRHNKGREGSRLESSLSEVRRHLDERGFEGLDDWSQSAVIPGEARSKHPILQEIQQELAKEEANGQHHSVSRSETQDGFSSARKSDAEYMAAVNRYQNAATEEERTQALSDLQDMVQEAAENAGFHNAIPEQTTAYRVRTGAAPKKTVKVYKVFTVSPDGAPTALFVSGTEKLPQGVWLDAQAAYHFLADNGKYYVPSTQNPYTKGGKTGKTVAIPNEEVRQELIKRGFLKPGSKAKNITALAYRPGWHAGTLPFFPQGGVKNASANYGMMHRANQVVFECELAADKDYTQEARSQEKAYSKAGKLNLRNADLQYMPENGYYFYATNPLTQSHPELGAWAISGSLKINRALTQEECDRILSEKGMKPQAWEQGKMNLADLGYAGEQNDAARKTLAPITYDDAGEVIPLSERFNPEKADVRYSISKEETEKEEDAKERGHSYVRAVADKLGKALHLKSDKIITEEDAKDPNDINLKQSLLSSPSRVAAKVPVFRVLYRMGARAMDKCVGLRNDFNRKLDGALGDLKKSERQELFDTLLKGDAEGKEWTRDELIADGASEAVADAYIKIRRQLNKAYHLVDNARRKPTPKSKTVTQEELDQLKANKFVEDLSYTDKGIGEDGKRRYLASYKEARNHKESYKEISADMVARFQRDDGIQVLDVQEAKTASGHTITGDDGKPLYNVLTAEGPAHLGKLTGYIPHFFHEYMIRIVDENGKSRVIGSGRNQREAVMLGEAWIKSHDLKDGESIHVAPKVFDINQALGVSDKDFAPIMGDRDFFRVQQNLAKQNDMTLNEARDMLDGSVRLKGRHRFFGNALHRTGAEGYETDLNWALRHYFNSAARYVAMETEFKPKAISYFERMFGAFDKEYSGTAKYCKDYINDINGNPSALEEAISKALNSTWIFKKVVIPAFGDRAALTLGNTVANKISYLTLGLNMSSALLNFTQLMNSAAYLGDPRTLVTMAAKGAHHKYTMRELRILHETGVFNDIGLDSGSGYDQMRGGSPSFGNGRMARAITAVNRRMDWAGNKSMLFFREADAICRRGTVLAAYEKARKEGKTHAEAIAYAKDINDKANFQYGVQDAPNLFRRGSIVSQLLLQFKKYGIKELEVMGDFTFGNKTSRKQKLMFWAMYAMLCGAMGVPALDWLDEIFGEKTGFYTKDEMQKAIIHLCGDNRRLAAILMYGIPAALNINLSSRAGLSDVLPTSLGDFAGPTASKSVRFVQDALGGDWVNALRDVSPGLYNMYAAAIGESTGKRGRINDRYDDPMSRLLRAVGFRSVNESAPVDMQRIISRDKAAATKEKQEAQDAYIKDPSAENKQRLRDLGVDPKTVTKEAQKKQQTREERMESTVPKKDAEKYKALVDYAKGW